jgi:putative intracellular protease/amidase
MHKKAAVLIVNPVNGSGLFQYLEAFSQNNIPFTTFAVASTTTLMTDSGVIIKANERIGFLKGNEDEYDALVFSCGNAMLKFVENVDKPYYQDLIEVVKTFGAKDKLIIGHCVAALIFDNIEKAAGRKASIHPFVKSALHNMIGTDEKTTVDGNFFTAQDENVICELLPKVIEALK